LCRGLGEPQPSQVSGARGEKRPKIGQKVIFFEKNISPGFCSVFYGDSFCSWNRAKKMSIFPTF
jgi:hypothetical protein